MVVRNFNIRRISVAPAEADAPLVIDANAPLSGPIFLQEFQPIAWRNPQTLDAGRDLQGRDELFGRNVSLPENAGQRTNLDLAVHGHDTAFGTAPHDDMAARLTEPLETEAFKCSHHGGTRNMRQFRHAREY